MQMSELEITNSYKEAKNKKSQIGVLADLNCCSKEEIISVLKKSGIDGRTLPRQKNETRDNSTLNSEDNAVILEALGVYKKVIIQEENELDRLACEIDQKFAEAERITKKIMAATERMAQDGHSSETM